MSPLATADRNGKAPCSAVPAETATMVDAIHLVDEQRRAETVPERRQRWERIRNRLLSLMITHGDRVDRLDLTAEQDGCEVVVGVLFPREGPGQRLRVRLEALDQDAQTLVQLALIQRGLATPIRVAVATPSGP